MYFYTAKTNQKLKLNTFFFLFYLNFSDGFIKKSFKRDGGGASFQLVASNEIAS